MTGLRTEVALRRLNHRLIRGNVRLVERRRILSDLRVNLRDASSDVGEREALTRLGNATALADEYVAGSRDRPRWRGGLVWAGWTVAVLVALTLLRLPTFG